MLKMYAARQRKYNNEMASHLISSQAQRKSLSHFYPRKSALVALRSSRYAFAMPCYTMLTQLLAAPLLAPLVGIAPGHAISRAQVVSTYQNRESSNMGFMLLLSVKQMRNFMLCSTSTFTGPSNWLPPFSQKPKSSMTS